MDKIVIDTITALPRANE
uniref:Uncharacterized protein n=1 Tax=Anguilla anguilla TaxID=7936 RepID=A0A0E9V267_ANGAN